MVLARADCQKREEREALGLGEDGLLASVRSRSKFQPAKQIDTQHRSAKVGMPGLSDKTRWGGRRRDVYETANRRLGRGFGWLGEACDLEPYRPW
jgi:hypothetical protein